MMTAVVAVAVAAVAVAGAAQAAGVVARAKVVAVVTAVDAVTVTAKARPVARAVGHSSTCRMHARNHRHVAPTASITLTTTSTSAHTTQTRMRGEMRCPMAIADRSTGLQELLQPMQRTRPTRRHLRRTHRRPSLRRERP